MLQLYLIAQISKVLNLQGVPCNAPAMPNSTAFDTVPVAVPGIKMHETCKSLVESSIKKMQLESLEPVL